MVASGELERFSGHFPGPFGGQWCLPSDPAGSDPSVQIDTTTPPPHSDILSASINEGAEVR